MSYRVLTPLEMFDIIARERAWMFNPGLGSGELIWEESRAGAAAGGQRAGSSVFALIQVVDGGGDAVCLARGDHVHIKHLIADHHRDEAGEHYHAEEKALNTLDHHIRSDMKFPGGKMTVLVDQVPCDETRHDCRGKLRRYADKHGLELEIWLPSRPSLTGSGSVQPRTATKTSMRTGYPDVELVRWP